LDCLEKEIAVANFLRSSIIVFMALTVMAGGVVAVIAG
jgi:hypothetical protein